MTHSGIAETPVRKRGFERPNPLIAGGPDPNAVIRIRAASRLKLRLRRPRPVGAFLPIYTIGAFLRSLRRGRPESTLKGQCGSRPGTTRLGKTNDARAARREEYLPRPSDSALSLRFNNAPGHKQVEVTEAHFDDIASAIRSFWEAFPERLFLNCTSGP